MTIDGLVDVQAGLGQARSHHRQGHWPIDSGHGAKHFGEGCEVADPQLFAQVCIGAQGKVGVVEHALACCIAKVAEGVYLQGSVQCIEAYRVRAVPLRLQDVE
ncbi:hypothetical protein D3C72_1546260 [compost metagenome]